MGQDNARQERNAAALRVPRAHAETARRELRAADLLDTDLSPVADADSVLLPLRTQDEDVMARIRALVPGATPTRHAFPLRAAAPASYRDLLGTLAPEHQVLLPRAHDVIGDIAILKLPTELEAHKKKIAAAILTARPTLHTVALDHGVKGEHRVRDLEIIAGGPGLVTIHREHGTAIEVDLATTYFSPRLATERDRLLARIQEGARVLDLFAGVGALVVRVARERNPAAITAIDLNPHAVRLLERNLERNKVPRDRVDVRQGDARTVAPRSHDWDHVVMNLPHDAHHFLDIAAERVAPGGEVHLYAILEQSDVAAYTASAQARLERHAGRAFHLAETRHVRAYAPTMDGLAFTFAAHIEG